MVNSVENVPHVNIPSYDSDSDHLSGRGSEDQDEIRSSDENADRSQTGREEGEIHYEENVGDNQTGEKTGSNPEELRLGGNAIERDRGIGAEQLLQEQDKTGEDKAETNSSRECKPKTVYPNLILPRIKSTVRYKPRDEEIWRFIEVTSSGGKVSGKYKDYLNVKDTVTNEQMCINWKQDVQKGNPVEDEEILINNASCDDLKFQQAKLA